MLDESQLELLRQLVASPSPSGFEQSVQEVIRRESARYAEAVSTDRHGNVIASLNAAGHPRVMLTAHCDEVGLLVRYIDEQGFLYFAPIGSFDSTTLPGERVEIHTPGGPLPGVIGAKPIHLKSPAEREKAPDLNEMWIDIGAASQEEARRLVPLGSPVTRAARLERLHGDLVVSRALDNKAGILAILEALRRVAAARQRLRAALYLVSTVQEELGSRGAHTSTYGVEPDIALVVDVTYTADHPQTSRHEIGEIKLNGGPVLTVGAAINPRVYQLLVQTATAAGLSYQIDVQAGYTGTDTDTIQMTRAGVATGLISIPCRYLHTGSEIVSLKDVTEVALLLTEFVLALETGINLIS